MRLARTPSLLCSRMGLAGLLLLGACVNLQKPGIGDGVLPGRKPDPGGALSIPRKARAETRQPENSEAKDRKPSNIMLVGRAGARIFLNGDPVGSTNDDFGGLLIRGLTTSSVVLEAFRDGFNVAKQQVDLREGETVYVNLVEFVPPPNADPMQELRLVREVGDVVVLAQSAEPAVSVRLHSSSGVLEGSTPVFFRGIPAGTALLKVTFANGDTLQHEVSVKPGQLGELVIDRARRRVFERERVDRERRGEPADRGQQDSNRQTPEASPSPKRKPL